MLVYYEHSFYDVSYAPLRLRYGSHGVIAIFLSTLLAYQWS